MKVLYIAGYGRSGSTILDIMLGDQPNIASIGEATYLYDDWPNPNRCCACGRRYKDCEVWGDVLTSDEVSRCYDTIRKIESRRNLPLLLSNSFSKATKQAYRRHCRNLFQRIAKKTGAEVLIDSSKSAKDAAGRFWALKYIAGLDVHVLHLVRDSRSTVNSVVSKGTNWALEGHGGEKMFPGLRTVLGWTLSNAVALYLGNRFPADRYLRVRYEDLRRNHEEEIRRITKFIGVDLHDVVNQIDAGRLFRVHHNVGGNRVRLKGEVRFCTTPGQGTSARLSMRHRMAVTLLSGWLQRYFNYD